MGQSPLVVRYDDFRSFLGATSGRISEEGVFLPSEESLPVGSRVAFEVGLGPDFPLLRGSGEVVRTVEKGAGDEPSGMAVRFLSTDVATRELVGRIVARHRSEGGASFELPAPASHRSPAATAVPTAVPADSESRPAGRRGPERSRADAVSGTGQDEVLAVPDLSDEGSEVAAGAGLETDVTSAVEEESSKRGIDADLDALLGESEEPAAEPGDEVSESVPAEESASASAQGLTEQPVAAAPLAEPPLPYYLTQGRAERRRSGAWRGWLAAGILGLALGALAFWQKDALRELILAWRTSEPSPVASEPEKLPTISDREGLGAMPEDADAEEGVVPATSERVPVTSEPATSEPEDLGTLESAGTTPPGEPIELTAEDGSVLLPDPSPGPAAEEALRVPATPPSEVTRISWDELGESTLLRVETDGTLGPGAYAVERIGGASPRVVIRVRGIDRPFAPRLEVGTEQVVQLRTGLHEGPAGPELHVVADLAGPDVVVTDSAAVDGVLQLWLSASAGSP